uniref:Maspardin n=1 Tax=Caligus clemensi TaxID=344056 RepID=C1C1M0_CALCM|nr:Maspardin [Caligus clemensi]
MTMHGVSETEIGTSEEYQVFRSRIPLRKLDVGDTTGNCKTWAYFDCGPRCALNRRAPLVFIPSTMGTADMYYLQALSLSAKGYRVILIQWPPYWSISAWCEGFKELLGYLELEKVHLFGTSLGGFLAQKFTEYTNDCPRVSSLILCDSYSDASVFDYREKPCIFWMAPQSCLRNIVLMGFRTESNDHRIHMANDFMIERLECLSQEDLASRLFLNSIPTHVCPQKVNEIPITIIDAWDESTFCHQIKEETYKYYPNAKLAHLKTGGNFPFLSRCEEVNLFILIHMKNFDRPS